MEKIVLIGFACCGKSTVGKILADKIAYRFVDTDCEIERRSNLTVAEIFERFGENKFRQMENELLRELVDNNTVVACGGGSVLTDNFDTFVQNSAIVWLTATAQTVRERLTDSIPRPLFDKLSVGQLQEYISLRTPIYAKYARVQIATDGKTPEQVAEEIYNKIISKE